MITEERLDALRNSLCGEMSPKRYRHTVEVEKMAARLGEMYIPDRIMKLRAAALLHDITKEYYVDKHLLICADNGLALTREDLLAPKTFHARTAAALIPCLYPEFNDDEIISAVRWHTTGRRCMSLMEKLIYLADYIDMSRTFSDCVALREFFFGKEPEKMSAEERMAHLDDTLILSFDMTVRGLIEDGSVVSSDTFEARNYLIAQRSGR